MAKEDSRLEARSVLGNDVEEKEWPSGCRDGGALGRIRFRPTMGLWQKIRDWLSGRDEPTLPDDEDAPTASTVQYPTADMNIDRGGEESADEQREGEGFR